MGAGHSFTEYAAIGQRFDPPSVRKARLAESVEIIRRLLDGEVVTHHGQHYDLDQVRTLRSMQGHVPLLVGVNGKQALGHAAKHADIIGLTMLGRTLEDGQRHEVRWEQDRLDATVTYIREQAGHRWDRIELNVLVQRIIVTGDREEAAHEVSLMAPRLTVEDALATPFLAIGTHDEIADHLRACRDRWDISYFSVRDIASFEPVIQRLRRPGEAAS
jgi:probable F420-dependent oxidoreductase